MAVTWDEEYSVGVSVIDEQHKQFVVVLGKLEKAVAELEQKERLSQILEDLDSYVVFHFGTEEKYFKEFNYGGAREHIEAHRKFAQTLSETREKYQNNELRLSYELVTFMSDWLVSHVRDMDRKYIECFRSHGLV